MFPAHGEPAPALMLQVLSSAGCMTSDNPEVLAERRMDLATIAVGRLFSGLSGLSGLSRLRLFSSLFDISEILGTIVRLLPVV